MQCQLCKKETGNDQEICDECLEKVRHYEINNSEIQIKALECPQCGAKLTFTQEKKLANCPSCGFEHIVSDPNKIEIELKHLLLQRILLLSA